MNEDVKTVPAIIYIPDNAVKITVRADIIDPNLSLHNAEMVLNMAQLNEAKIDGEYWESENVKYVFVGDKGNEDTV